ncbi:MAG: tyrosine protein phosphatase [Alphaproteobacteria bacterium HGW-Alphaproteobacteria-11]|nr:MAG: tyrosine protein phosphatase [Alphaproteobacteria bacterium HGW-Alphaproteobacteria-11]
MIYVSPLSAVEDAVASLRPSHLVSLLDPETMIGTPRGIAPARHLRLGVNDIAEPLHDLVPPGAEHVSSLIEFVRGWDQQSPLLVHCWAGISRSSAAAFIALCALNEDHPEAELARLIRSRGAHAHPNRLMVRIADELLARQGRMSAAVEALGPGRAVWEGEIFSVPVRPGAA